MREIRLHTRIVFGENALDCLREIENKRVLIVCDKFMLDSGVVDHIAALPVNSTVTVFSEVVPDPPIDVVAKGVKMLEDAEANVVVAVGGGSPIDAAKAICAMATRVPSSKVSNLDFFAIPTTSGTGSEVTEYAVITDAKTNLKYTLTNPDMRPHVAVLAPELVVSAPPSITADTGMDVLTHALEALVSQNANDFSDALAEKAASMVFHFLPMAFDNGEDLLAREKMHNASCLAGMSFNSAGLGLNHSIAHAIGAKLHIPHGRINAMLLPLVIQFNAGSVGNAAMGGAKEDSVAALKYARLARIIKLPTPSVSVAIRNLVRDVERLMRHVKIPFTLKEYGIDAATIRAMKDELTDAALTDPTLATNPRPVTAQDVQAILNKLVGMNR